MYEGYWADNHMNFYGRLVYENGDAYTGEWVSDRCSGFGTYYQYLEGSKYVGQWDENSQNGYGIEEWTGGTRYEGNFVNG